MLGDAPYGTRSTSPGRARPVRPAGLALPSAKPWRALLRPRKHRQAPPVTDSEALPGELAIPAGSNCEKITYRRDPHRHLAMPGTASSRRRARSPRCAVRAPRWHRRKIEAYRTFGETVNTCAYPSRTIVRLNRVSS